MEAHRRHHPETAVGSVPIDPQTRVPRSAKHILMRFRFGPTDADTVQYPSDPTP